MFKARSRTYAGGTKTIQHKRFIFNWIKFEDITKWIVFPTCSRGELSAEPRFIFFSSVGEEWCNVETAGLFATTGGWLLETEMDS
jgi:hypothetical protein